MSGHLNEVTLEESQRVGRKTETAIRSVRRPSAAYATVSHCTWEAQDTTLWARPPVAFCAWIRAYSTMPECIPRFGPRQLDRPASGKSADAVTGGAELLVIHQPLDRHGRDRHVSVIGHL